MKRFEYYSSDVEKMAELISQVAYGRYDEWAMDFYKQFCGKCETTHVVYTEIRDCDGNLVRTFEKGERGSEDDLHPCDYVDGVCPHGSDIVWWLNEEYVEGK